MRITVNRVDPDNALKTYEWRFFVFIQHDEIVIVLGQYYEMEKASSRHKSRMTGVFDRLHKRDSTFKSPPVVPGSVMQEVLHLTKQKVVFKTEL